MNKSLVSTLSFYQVKSHSIISLGEKQKNGETWPLAQPRVKVER